MKSPPCRIFPRRFSARLWFIPNLSNFALFQNTLIFPSHCETEKEEITPKITHSILSPPIVYIQDSSTPWSTRPEVVQAEFGLHKPE